MKKSESIVELAKALAKFQSEVKQPLKDANNPFFKSKYVPLENVVEAITTTAGPLGLSFTQWATTTENGTPGVSTLVMHDSGEWIEYPPIYAKPQKADPQGIGSVITYLKRYALSAVFGITSDSDDDGNAASAPPSGPRQQQQPTPPKLRYGLTPQQISELWNDWKFAKNDDNKEFEAFCKAQFTNKASFAQSKLAIKTLAEQ